MQLPAASECVFGERQMMSGKNKRKRDTVSILKKRKEATEMLRKKGTYDQKPQDVSIPRGKFCAVLSDIKLRRIVFFIFILEK